MKLRGNAPLRDDEPNKPRRLRRKDGVTPEGSPDLSKYDYNRHYKPFRRKFPPKKTTAAIQTDITTVPSLKRKRPAFDRRKFTESKKQKLFEIDVREVKEFRSMATGYANNTTLRRNREKIYYAVWKKAFETAVRVIADKRGKPIKVTQSSDKKQDKGTGPMVQLNNAAIHRTITTEGFDKFIQAIDADNKRTTKVPAEQNVSVKIVQKRGMEVLTLRKGTNQVVKNNVDTKSKEETVSNPDSKKKEDTSKKPDAKTDKIDKGVGPKVKQNETETKKVTSPKQNDKTKSEVQDKAINDVQETSVFIKIKHKAGKEVLTIDKNPRPVKQNDVDQTKQDTFRISNDKTKEDKHSKQDAAKSDDTKNKSNKEQENADKQSKDSDKNKTTKTDAKADIKDKTKVESLDKSSNFYQETSVYVKVKHKAGKEIITIDKTPRPVKQNEVDPTKQDTKQKQNDTAKEDKLSKQDTVKSKSDDTKSKSNKVQENADALKKDKDNNKVTKTDAKSNVVSDVKVKHTSDKTASNDKDIKASAGTIQVIQKGNKEVLTTAKIPEDAKIKTYKPDAKEKKEGETKSRKPEEEKQPSKATDKTTSDKTTKVPDPKLTNDNKTIKTNEKDKKVAEGSIQVIQKGSKEVLTTNKIPENAKVTYVPDIKDKKEGASKTKQSEEKQSSSEYDKTTKGSYSNETIGAKANKTSKVTDKITNGSKAKDSNDIKTKQTNEKDKNKPEGTIQVIQKGNKEILTSNKINDGVIVKTYKPDIKGKEDDSKTKVHGEKQPSKITDQATKQYGSKAKNDTKNDQKNEKDIKLVESSIQVIQKGKKEILTHKIPDNAIVNTYKPDTNVNKGETNNKDNKPLKGSKSNNANGTTANQKKAANDKDILDKQNTGRQENGTPIPGGAIKVVLKGHREVLTLRKFPSNADATTYKPESKTKHEKPTSDNIDKAAVKPKDAKDKTEKKTGNAVSKRESAKQTISTNTDKDKPKENTTRESKGTSNQGGAIQVIQKGSKEVLTLRKIPEHEEVKTYKPDTKQVEKDTARDKSKQETKVQAKQSAKPDKDVKQNDAKQTKQGEIESKGTVAPGGSIQVVQKGEKEVLTLRKPPNNAVVTTYKPDIKVKADDVTIADKKLKPDASVKQTQITPANRTGGAGVKASDVKQIDTKQTKQGEIESKGTVAPGGSIQVVQKGEKEVLTLRKPPNNAVVTTYKPDINAKADDVTSAEKKLKQDASVKQTKITPANRTGGAGIKANDDKITKPKTSKQNDKDAKDTNVSAGVIQVIQKGDKEVLTLRKPPDKATVNTYTPDTKPKEDNLRSTNNGVLDKDAGKSDVKSRNNKDVSNVMRNSISVPANKSKQESNDAKDAKEPSGTIKVILKGQKEVLTLTKLPEDAVIASYKPDTKYKDGKGSNQDKVVKEGGINVSRLKGGTTDNNSKSNVNNISTSKGTTADSKVPSNEGISKSPVNGTLQVVLKGGKEVFTLQRIPENAEVSNQEYQNTPRKENKKLQGHSDKISTASDTNSTKKRNTPDANKDMIATHAQTGTKTQNAKNDFKDNTNGNKMNKETLGGNIPRKEILDDNKNTLQHKYEAPDPAAHGNDRAVPADLLQIQRKDGKEIISLRKDSNTNHMHKDTPGGKSKGGQVITPYSDTKDDPLTKVDITSNIRLKHGQTEELVSKQELRLLKATRPAIKKPTDANITDNTRITVLPL